MFAGTCASLHPDTRGNSACSSPTPSTDCHSRDSHPWVTILDRQHAGEGTMMGKSQSRLCCEQCLQSDACSARRTGIQGAPAPGLSPGVCETHGILLQVCSLSYSSGQDESPEGTAWLQEQIPGAAVCPCSMGRDLLQPSTVAPPAQHSFTLSVLTSVLPSLPELCCLPGEPQAKISRELFPCQELCVTQLGWPGGQRGKGSWISAGRAPCCLPGGSLPGLGCLGGC